MESLPQNIKEILLYAGQKNDAEFVQKIIDTLEENVSSDKLFVSLGMVMKEAGCKNNSIREEIVKSYIAFRNGTKYIIPMERYVLALKTFKKSLQLTFKDIIEKKYYE